MADLKIDPEAVNRYIAEQITESAIGESLKKAIDEQVKTISRSYDNPLRVLVASELQRLAREYLQEPEVQAQLRAVIESKMTPKVLEEIVDGIRVKSY
jgi:hypothetical protein